MKLVETFPHRVREIENEWIPLSDGCRLAARIWLPEGALRSPVPAVFEYLPYRKRDFTRWRDEQMHRYFAGHGYAGVRVDLRGSGESDGLLLDEYLRQEHDDALEVIRWIASQPWCSGSVGMIGISWGGFNALQVAARRPPELGAIITLCASDDRYADDAHFMGGCLLNENLTWGSVLFAFNAFPPDPELVGSRWRDMWRERLENAVLFPELWIRKQRRDEYWKHGSVCEDFGQIQCPVYAIGGWADGYSNSVPRLLAGLRVPRKGLIGPWAHVFPNEGVPGPAIGFLQEALRWWDQWLGGRETGIMDEPAYRVWMQERVPPLPFYDERPGRWVAETGWPSERIEKKRLVLGIGYLAERVDSESSIDFRSPETTGLAAGDWCAFGSEGEMPIDQRAEDGKSLCFDTDPLEERLEILGAPVVALELSLDRPAGFVAVRLNDVAPEGASTRVTYGVLNLTHRSSHEHPEPLVPGKRYRVVVELNHIAHAFPPGHNVRVAVSTSYWPLVWPAPEPVTLTLHTGASTLELPVRPPRAEDAELAPFQPPERAQVPSPTKLRDGVFQRTFERDLATNETVYTVFNDGEFDGASIARLEAIDLEVGYRMLRRYRIGDDDPLSARAEVEQQAIFRRGGWSIRVECQTLLSATPRQFRLQASLDAFESDEKVFTRSWNCGIPRDGV